MTVFKSHSYTFCLYVMPHRQKDKIKSKEKKVEDRLITLPANFKWNLKWDQRDSTTLICQTAIDDTPCCVPHTKYTDWVFLNNLVKLTAGDVLHLNVGTYFFAFSSEGAENETSLY